MSNIEGTTIVIAGDEYQIIKNYGDLLVLQRNGFQILYFEKLKTLLACNVKKTHTRDITDNGDSLTFMGVKFLKTGYQPGECSTKNITTSINGTRMIFNIDKKSNKLLKVTD